MILTSGIYLCVFLFWVTCLNGVIAQENSEKCCCDDKTKNENVFRLRHDNIHKKNPKNDTNNSEDIFRKIGNDSDLIHTSETLDKGYYTALCWSEIMTITERSNGSKSITKEYAITFETQSDIPEKYLKTKQQKPEYKQYRIYNQHTKKSQIVNFTTVSRNDDVIVRQHKRMLCGSGPIYTKEFINWPQSDRKRIEIKVSPKEGSLAFSPPKHFWNNQSTPSKTQRIPNELTTIIFVSSANKKTTPFPSNETSIDKVTELSNITESETEKSPKYDSSTLESETTSEEDFSKADTSGISESSTEDLSINSSEATATDKSSSESSSSDTSVTELTTHENLSTINYSTEQTITDGRVNSSVSSTEKTTTYENLSSSSSKETPTHKIPTSSNITIEETTTGRIASFSSTEQATTVGNAEEATTPVSPITSDSSTTETTTDIKIELSSTSNLNTTQGDLATTGGSQYDLSTDITATTQTILESSSSGDLTTLPGNMASRNHSQSDRDIETTTEAVDVTSTSQTDTSSTLPKATSRMYVPKLTLHASNIKTDVDGYSTTRIPVTYKNEKLRKFDTLTSYKSLDFETGRDSTPAGEHILLTKGFTVSPSISQFTKLQTPLNMVTYASDDKTPFEFGGSANRIGYEETQPVNMSNITDTTAIYPSPDQVKNSTHIFVPPVAFNYSQTPICVIPKQKISIKVRVTMNYVLEPSIDGTENLKNLPILGLEKDIEIPVESIQDVFAVPNATLNKEWDKFLGDIGTNFFILKKPFIENFTNYINHNITYNNDTPEDLNKILSKETVNRVKTVKENIDACKAQLEEEIVERFAPSYYRYPNNQINKVNPNYGFYNYLLSSLSNRNSNFQHNQPQSETSGIKDYKSQLLQSLGLSPQVLNDLRMYLLNEYRRQTRNTYPNWFMVRNLPLYNIKDG